MGNGKTEIQVGAERIGRRKHTNKGNEKKQIGYAWGIKEGNGKREMGMRYGRDKCENEREKQEIAPRS